MLQGFYTAASGILQQERSINVLTNNMVNARTPGFRASRVVSTTFEQELTARIEKNNNANIGSTAPIRVVDEVPVSFETGSLEETERDLDFAINGYGFFVIADEDDDPRYLTRNGGFELDEEGYLTLRGAGRVMGEGGPIQLEDANFTVDYYGYVYDAAGEEIDQLMIRVVPEETQITQLRDGLFTIEDMDDLEELEQDEFQILQSFLERSNIDLQQEYLMVMEAQRAFQACSSALQIVDRLNQKAATQIASL